MEREEFAKVVEEVLDSLPDEFHKRVHNVAVLVEDLPPGESSIRFGLPTRLTLGVFHGVPTTRKSFFDLPTGPDYIVLYQKKSKRFAPTTSNSANKSGELLSTNSVTTSGWTKTS